MSYRITHTDTNGGDVRDYKDIAQYVSVQPTIGHLENIGRKVTCVVDEYQDWEDITERFKIKNA